MGGLGAPELVIILIIVLLVFGGAKLPKLARSLGEAQKEFKKGVREGANEDDDEVVKPADTTAAEPTKPSDTTT